MINELLLYSAITLAIIAIMFFGYYFGQFLKLIKERDGYYLFKIGKFSI